MRAEVLLQESAKVMGAGEDLIGGPQREQPIGVDQLEADRDLRRGGFDHAGQKNAG